KGVPRLCFSRPGRRRQRRPHRGRPGSAACRRRRLAVLETPGRTARRRAVHYFVVPAWLPPRSTLGNMLAAFGFETLGVVVGDMFCVDPTPNEGQETRERGVRLELRVVDRAEPQGSIYAGIPIAFNRPVWRVDLFGSTESPPGTLDRAHHHPRFT